jgi:sulfite exporter TauE/SafE
LPWPTDSLPWILFVAGLVGGAGHCVGMCGPLVAGYAIALRNRAATLPHLFFHMGRVTTYGLAGGVVGASGSFVRVAEWLGPFQSFLLAAIGALIALMGLSVGGWLPWARRIEESGPFRGALAGVARRAAEAGGPGAAFPLGMAAGLLPCGLVYTALLSAARSGMEGGSPADGFVRGALAMAAFGAGTFPALFLFGKVVAAAGPRLRGGLAKAAAVLLVATGVLFCAHCLL